MKSPEEIESALHRLVPPALSSPAQRRVSAMLADLAAQSTEPATAAVTPSSARVFPFRRLFVSSAAAAVLLLGLRLSPSSSPVSSPAPPLAALAGSSQEISPAPAVLIDRMLVTGDPTIVHTVTESDGSIIKQIHRRVQSHERFRDSRKGYLITVSETRDEKLYLPKNSF
jgi:hypothetical protein